MEAHRGLPVELQKLFTEVNELANKKGHQVIEEIGDMLMPWLGKLDPNQELPRKIGNTLLAGSAVAVAYQVLNLAMQQALEAQNKEVTEQDKRNLLRDINAVIAKYGLGVKELEEGGDQN